MGECSLTDQLSSSLIREAELKTQLSWEKLQFKNQVDSFCRQIESKDGKIEKLQKEVEVKVSQIRVANIFSKIITDRGCKASSTCQANLYKQLGGSSGQDPGCLKES